MSNELSKSASWEITDEEYKQIKGIAYLVYSRTFEGVDFDDLFQEGLLAYAIAKQKYNPEKNDYFMGFAYKRIKGRMLDWVSKQALNGRAATRKSEGDPTDKSKYRMEYLPNIDDLLDLITFNKDLQEFQMERDDIEKKVRFYLDNFLSDAEYYLLYKYIIDNEPLVGLVKEIDINKVRLRAMFKGHLFCLQEFILHNTIKGQSYENIIGE